MSDTRPLADERLFPVFNGTVLNGTADAANPYHDPRAPVHIVAGAAGCQEHSDDFPETTQPGPWSAVRLAEYGYGKLRVWNDSHATWSQIRSPDGAVRDEVTIVKSRPAYAPAQGSFESVTDRSTAHSQRLKSDDRGLRVGGLPFVPFGAYTQGIHSAPPTLQHGRQMVSDNLIPEMEVVHGLSLVAPYNHGLPSRSSANGSAVLAYLDRCAAVGMQVHYSLCGSERWTVAELTDEVQLVAQHPAVFAIYTADEPDAPGSWVEPDRLRAVYRNVKAVAPHLPVSICFTAGLARNFSGAFDIALVDPYPIGDGPGTPLSILHELDAALALGVPVIFAAQAYGGAGRRKRTPTAAEERVMAYIALIRGAVGVQYFIRQAPNSGPYAPSAWSEVRQVALEVS